jgi:hypothetical protein
MLLLDTKQYVVLELCKQVKDHAHAFSVDRTQVVASALVVALSVSCDVHTGGRIEL